MSDDPLSEYEIQKQQAELDDERMKRRRAVMFDKSPVISEPEPEDLVLELDETEMGGFELLEDTPPSPEDMLRQLTDDLIKVSWSAQKLAGNSGKNIDSAPDLSELIDGGTLHPKAQEIAERMQKYIPLQLEFGAGKKATQAISPTETMVRSGVEYHGRKPEKASVMDRQGNVIIKPGASDDPRALEILAKAYQTVLGERTSDSDLKKRGAAILGSHDPVKSSQLMRDMDSHLLGMTRELAPEHQQRLGGLVESGFDLLTGSGRGSLENYNLTHTALQDVVGHSDLEMSTITIPDPPAPPEVKQDPPKKKKGFLDRFR